MIFNRIQRFFIEAGAEAGGSPTTTTAAAPGVTASPAGTTSAPVSSTGTEPQFREPAQLRSAYDSLKTEHESYKQLGAVDEIKAAQTTYNSAVTELTPLATALGYSADELKQAIKEVGIGKLSAYLYQETAKQRTQQQAADPLKALEEKVNKTLEPILTERQQAQIDRAYQNVETKGKELAIAKFGTAADVKDHPELVDDLFDFASALMAQEPAVVARLRAGNTNDVAKFIDLAYTRLQKSYEMFGAFMQKRGAGTGNRTQSTQSRPGETKLTLDDIIFGNEKATAAMGSMR